MILSCSAVLEFWTLIRGVFHRSLGEDRLRNDGLFGQGCLEVDFIDLIRLWGFLFWGGWSQYWRVFFFVFSAAQTYTELAQIVIDLRKLIIVDDVCGFVADARDVRTTLAIFD